MNRHTQQAFTLIELMIVMVIVAIIAAIAIPSYTVYVRRVELSTTENEMRRIETLLEKHRSRSFSYEGFKLANQKEYQDTDGDPLESVTEKIDKGEEWLQLPLKTKTGEDGKFTLILKVDANSWSLKAESKDPQNDSLLLTSSGYKCKTKTFANITDKSCGVDSGVW